MAAVTGLAAGLVPSSFAPAAAYVNPADPDVVAVAGGSYAAAPPASLDGPGHNVSDTVAKQLYIDASQTGKPVPTNAWWTDLAVSKHSGDLWADPLVNRNTVDGTSIYYPTRWNADGSARVLESPLTAFSIHSPTPPATAPGERSLHRNFRWNRSM
jgi:endoglucanase Acf2